MKTGRILIRAVATAVMALGVIAAGSGIMAAEKPASPVEKGARRAAGDPAVQVASQGRAWLHGIPGDNTPGGIPVEISSHPADRRARFTIKANSDALAKIKALQERRARLNLKLVVRQNAGDKQDTVYNLGDATIESIQGDAAQTSSISMSFDRMSKVAGYQLNPGIPAGAAAISPTGINRGWVHFAETKDPNGVPVDVVAYTVPEVTGQMKLTFKGSDTLLAKLKDLHAAGKGVDMLILMLPDGKTGKYVEYKLAKASVGDISYGEGTSAREAVFNSDTIECFTGANSE